VTAPKSHYCPRTAAAAAAAAAAANRFGVEPNVCSDTPPDEWLPEGGKWDCVTGRDSDKCTANCEPGWTTGGSLEVTGDCWTGALLVYLRVTTSKDCMRSRQAHDDSLPPALVHPEV
jgi:hypothetical protein